VSNRLPVSIQKNNDDLTVIPSSGGLATALHSYHRSRDSVWIGWPGVDAESDADKKNVTRLLARERGVCVD
jgi:trehalose 6-phosphate synthase/phosphatase